MRDWTPEDLRSYCEKNGEVEYKDADRSNGSLGFIGEDAVFGSYDSDDESWTEASVRPPKNVSQESFSVSNEEGKISRSFERMGNVCLITEFSGGEYPLLDIEFLKSLGCDDLNAILQGEREEQIIDLGGDSTLFMSNFDGFISITYYDEHDYIYSFSYDENWSDQGVEDIVISATEIGS